MISLVLAAAAAQLSVLDAERAFARLAQEKGQWTAFRATAEPGDSSLFVPDRVDALTWLEGRKDPPRSVAWWPTAAWQSCEGRSAVTTGGALWPDGSPGYFTTLWGRGGADNPEWRWSMDHGGPLATPRSKPATVTVRVASCAIPQGEPVWPALSEQAGRGTLGYSSSSDNSLRVRWYVAPDKSRGFSVALWTGRAYEIVLDDVVAASGR